MPNLTDKQRAFIEAHLEGKNATDAALAAGCNPRQAAQYGYRALRTPSVQAAIRAELRRRVDCNLAPLALGVLREILVDGTQPGGVRIRAVQLTLQSADFIGEGGRTRDAAGLDHKPLSEMTLEELARVAAEQRERLDAASQAVEDLRAEATAQANVLVLDAQVVADGDEQNDREPWS